MCCAFFLISFLRTTSYISSRRIHRFYPFDDSGIPFAGKTMVIKELQNQSNAAEDGGTALNVWDGSLLLYVLLLCSTMCLIDYLNSFSS